MSRILLVEDEEGIRTIARMTLEVLGGHEVCACASGEEALAKAAAFAPQLLLLDVSMPGMDGPSTLRELRKQPSLAAVPAVFLTANTQAGQVTGYREGGALDVIAKPFDPRQLANRVAAVLAGNLSTTAPAGESRALVVEDDAGIRYLLRFILEQQGWTVQEAVDGPQALEAIARGHVADAVLLDIMLPGIDGLALLERLRQSGRWDGVPVMMLTAKGDEASVKRALAAGAADYLGKPFDPGDLIERLRRLPRRGGSGPGRVTSPPSPAA